MTKREKEVVKNITEKTKSGEIVWRKDDDVVVVIGPGNAFFCNIDEVFVILGPGGLTLQDHGRTLHIDDNDFLRGFGIGGAATKLYNLVNKNFKKQNSNQFIEKLRVGEDIKNLRESPFGKFIEEELRGP